MTTESKVFNCKHRKDAASVKHLACERVQTEESRVEEAAFSRTTARTLKAIIILKNYYIGVLRLKMSPGLVLISRSYFFLVAWILALLSACINTPCGYFHR